MSKYKHDKRGKQRRLLHLIADHIWLHGYQPSYRQIAALFNYSSVGYIQALLGDLERKKVVRLDNKARAIVFPWRKYVTDKALSRHNGTSLGGCTEFGDSAA
jgi:SOS-response transcriptional repressor LexA